jgi:hypothetical protein
MVRIGSIFGLLVLSLPVQAADVISIDYDISLGGSRIMKADYSATLGDGSYSADLEAKTTGVSKWFAKIKLNMSAKGGLSETGLTPASYAYSRKKNDKRKQRVLNFAPGGTLLTDGEDYDASILSAIKGKVMDPLSMLLKVTRSGKPCSGTYRAFDGRDVFDLSLSGGNGTGALTCKVLYTPVAGADVDDGDTDATRYEITFAPIGDNKGYVAVRLTGSSKGVGFEARAKSVTLNGQALAY